jgi:hypothetical protein
MTSKTSSGPGVIDPAADIGVTLLGLDLGREGRGDLVVANQDVSSAPYGVASVVFSPGGDQQNCHKIAIAREPKIILTAASSRGSTW